MNVPAQILPSLLKLDHQTGKLFWLERTPEVAALSGRKNPAKAARAFNTLFSGREAFTAISPIGYRIGAIFNRPYSGHRVIWALLSGEWPALQVDHINGDRADNRPANLRLVTQSQNNANSRARAGTSRFKGVSWNPDVQKWAVQITQDGSSRRVEFFASEDAAARAYDAAATEIFGQFARTNAALGLFNQEKAL